jgi:PRA1 family protein 1
LWQAQARVEELDSDDDTDTQGVGLNFDKKRFSSDPLQFTGIDLTPATRARRPYNYDDSADSSEESESDIEVEGMNALQIALRDKEEALVQSALARIRRAQEKGKREVKLNQDELDALEKRRKRMQAAATATKERKGSASSGGSGSERRRRSDQHLVTVPIGEPTGRKRAKSMRREEAAPHPTATANPPGMLFEGPDGVTYAPLGYYPPQVGSSRNSPTRPRSATSQQLRGLPLQLGPGSSRHFSEGNRPVSSSSNSSRRPLPDEEDWAPSRRSSGSSQSHGVDPFEYQVSSDTPPPIPQKYKQTAEQSNRRVASGPPEIIYSTVRRSPPMNAPYPAAVRPSDLSPKRRSRRKDPYADELGDDGSSSEEDESDDLGNGVQVFVEEREHEREKERDRERVPRKPVGGGRKKGKGR